MTIETILKTDVLDIVFEKRNKLYGAYPLRKFYKNRLFGALTITIGAATILSAFTFIPENTVEFIPATDVTRYIFQHQHLVFHYLLDVHERKGQAYSQQQGKQYH